MNSQECIFCKIVAGEIPAATIYEDDHVLAFLDIGPVHKGHTLVIPKQHALTMDACAPETLAAIGSVLGRTAKAVVAATACDAYNCLCNNGRAAGQLVDHVHFHIIPRFKDDKLFKPWPAGQYEEGLAQSGLPKEFVALVMYLFTTVLDGRNSHLADGVQQALGREPRDFADYARETAATGVWEAQS